MRHENDPCSGTGAFATRFIRMIDMLPCARHSGGVTTGRRATINSERTPEPTRPRQDGARIQFLFCAFAPIK